MINKFKLLEFLIIKIKCYLNSLLVLNFNSSLLIKTALLFLIFYKEMELFLKAAEIKFFL